MVFILNVFSHLFHNWVVVGVFLFLELDSSHWLYLDNLFTLILSLLIVNRTYNFSDTRAWVPSSNVFIRIFKPGIFFQLSFELLISRWELLCFLNLSISEFVKLKHLRLTFFFLFIIFLVLESSFTHFNSNNQRYQLSIRTKDPLINQNVTNMMSSQPFP